MIAETWKETAATLARAASAASADGAVPGPELSAEAQALAAQIRTFVARLEASISGATTAPGGVEPRRHSRHAILLPARALFEFGALSVTIADISASGARLALSPGFRDFPDHFLLEIASLGRIPAMVRWRETGRCGVQFRLPGGPPKELLALIADLAAHAPDHR